MHFKVPAFVHAINRCMQYSAPRLQVIVTYGSQIKHVLIIELLSCLALMR